jgi:hypothetical protein
VPRIQIFIYNVCGKRDLFYFGVLLLSKKCRKLIVVEHFLKNVLQISVDILREKCGGHILKAINLTTSKFNYSKQRKTKDLHNLLNNPNAQTINLQ